MEYTVVLLVLALIAVFFIKNPNQVKSAITEEAISTIRKNEAEIVQGLHNKLPKEIKGKVDSKVLAEVVDYTLNVAINVIEDNAKKDENK